MFCSHTPAILCLFLKTFSFEASKSCTHITPNYLLAGQLFVHGESFPAQGGAESLQCVLTYICQYSKIIFIIAVFQQVLPVGILFSKCLDYSGLVDTFCMGRTLDG